MLRLASELGRQTRNWETLHVGSHWFSAMSFRTDLWVASCCFINENTLGQGHTWSEPKNRHSHVNLSDVRPSSFHSQGQAASFLVEAAETVPHLLIQCTSQPAPPWCWHGSCHMGDALNPLLCDRASCREHSQQLPIKGNPAKTTPAISWGLSPSQTLALNNTPKPSTHCQGGLQNGVRTFHLACALSAHSRNSFTGSRWRECPLLQQLTRGNSELELTEGKTQLASLQRPFSQLSLGRRLWHVFRASPKQAQTHQTPLITAAGLKDGI